MSNGILIDALTEQEDLVDNQEDENTQKQDPDNGFQMPDKLKGKSAEEIAKMYVEDERYKGELQNQLGEYRQMTDRLLGLEEKRVSDLEKGGAAEEDFDIDPTELLANPKEVMDRYYESRRKQDSGYDKLQERLDQIEAKTQEQQFLESHPDVQQVINDPAFVTWVNGHPVRSQIAAQAVQNNDYNSLDYLLSDYKGLGNAQASESRDPKAQELERAAKASTEKASSGGSSAGSGKYYKRSEIVDLKIHKPMEYRQRAEEFTRAYAEGRVKD